MYVLPVLRSSAWAMARKPEVVSTCPFRPRKSTCQRPSAFRTFAVSPPLVKQAASSLSAIAGFTSSSKVAKWGARSCFPAKWVTRTRMIFSRGAVNSTSRIAPFRVSPRLRTGRVAASTFSAPSFFSTRTHWAA